MRALLINLVNIVNVLLAVTAASLTLYGIVAAINMQNEERYKDG